MPLFNRHPEPEVIEPEPRRSNTLFSRKNREVSPVNTTTTRHSNKSETSSSPHRSFLHRKDGDPTILAARERVANAEAREKDADRALASARIAVKEAREHIKKLEKEAAEEARLAKIKQKEAQSIGKRGDHLGRELPDMRWLTGMLMLIIITGHDIHV